MRKILVSTLFCLVVSMPAVAQTPSVPFDLVTFAARLTPSNEVPPLTGVDASGNAIIGVILEVNNGEIDSARVDIEVAAQFGQEEIITALHIHAGAAGEDGPIVINFNFGDPQKVPEGEVSFYRSTDGLTDPSTLGTVQEILLDPTSFYVNLHTDSEPSGLIRGQLARTPNERFDALEEKLDELDRLKRKINRILRRL